MKNINVKQYKVTSEIQLSDYKTNVELDDDNDVKKELKKLRKKLGKLQDSLYAHGKYGVLICLQGMDTAGKDSMIREVFKDFNTRGIVVHSFKVPTSLELNHDYLWRHYIALPSRGKFSIFNRTHYENVLVTRVHPEYILGENLPNINTVADINEGFWEQRFEQIRNFEKHIFENGTLIFKFFLNLSKSEQKNRLLRRIELKEKNWKFSPGDLKERILWDKYQVCYQDAINKTATENAPWYVIPADHKPSARYIVAKTIYDKLKEFDDIEEPELSVDIKANLAQYKKELNEE
ncbi:MAG: phosphate--nucleotide phosphotransferase [Kordia sp.]|nr:MAG: phosphate--nucleotide phosphotransferase [Kordia sp.]